MLTAIFEAIMISLVASIGMCGVLWPICRDCFWMIFGNEEESD